MLTSLYHKTNHSQMITMKPFGHGFFPLHIKKMCDLSINHSHLNACEELQHYMVERVNDKESVISN